MNITKFLYNKTVTMELQEICCDSQFKVLAMGENILPPVLQDFMSKIVQKEGYITHKVLNRSISTRGANFMAELFEVDIKGKTAKGDKETNIFIKNKIENAITFIDVDGAWSMETFLYDELSEFYDVFQNKANIPLEERYNMVKSYDAPNSDAIILENLAKKGFSTCYRMDVIPLKFAELSVQQLARFHGLSWVLEKHHPKYFAKKIKSIQIPYIINEDFKTYFVNMSGFTRKLLDTDTATKLDEYVSGAMNKLREYLVENRKNGVRCCLCHGDYRANNILMKKDHNDEVTTVIPIDYQLLYYGCPVMDFIYLIFSCTDQQFRRKHLDGLKNLYYHSLTTFLAYFDIDSETVYSRHEFESMFKERLDYGLFNGLMLTPILFIDDNYIPDFSQDVQSLSVTPDPKMEERVLGLVEEFKEYGIL